MKKRNTYLVLAILLIASGCTKKAKLHPYYLVSDKENEVALFEIKENKDSVAGSIFWVRRKDTVQLKGYLKDSVFTFRTYKNEVDEDLDYRGILKNKQIHLTREDIHNKGYKDKFILKPISYNVYKKVHDKALVPPPPVNLSRDTIIGNYLFEIKVDNWESKPSTTFTIKDKKSGKEIQSIVSEDFLFNEDLYFSYCDLNYDTIKDLAFFNGNNGAYGTETYDYYIYSPHKKQFIYSKQLASIAGGMGIEFDDKKKRIISFDKSGCCWHQQKAFIAVKDTFIEVKQLVIDQDNNVITKSKVNGKWKTTKKHYKLLNDHTSDSIYKAF